jgi:geranylgeranyl diphosphate synthase type I
MQYDAFLKRLTPVKMAVEERLEAFLDRKIAEATRISSGSEEIMRVLKEFTLRGGKRLRAAFVYYGYRCFSSQETEAVWNVAMSLELVQSFLLIHDDVIDQDDTRRGDWTVHRHYGDLHRSRHRIGDPEHFGESMAILCGDLSLVLAHEILGGVDLEPPLKSAVLARMSSMVCNALYGESMDVISQAETEVSHQDVLTINVLKTASYTVEGPLQMGALLGGAGDVDLERLSRYAIPLGKAFQIQDDVLGLFGDAERLGKPVGSDIREGKRTSLILKAIEKANPPQREFLQGLLGNKDLTIEDLDEFRRLVVETGALDACKEEARTLAEASRKALKGCSWRPEGVEFLEEAPAFMVEREN